MRNRIVIFALFFSLFSIGQLLAQNFSLIAYVNSEELLDMLPEKEKARGEVLEFNNKYKEELQKMQNEYNKKYSDFISYQTSMAENIRLRRMQELFELEKQINKFVKIAQEDVVKKEKSLLDPLRLKVKLAISEVGIEGRYECIYDISNPAILFVTPDAVDITDVVKQKLKLK